MYTRPPITTRTDTLFPYTTLFLSHDQVDDEQGFDHTQLLRSDQGSGDDGGRSALPTRVHQSYRRGGGLSPTRFGTDPFDRPHPDAEPRQAPCRTRHRAVVQRFRARHARRDRLRSGLRYPALYARDLGARLKYLGSADPHRPLRDRLFRPRPPHGPRVTV